MWWSGINIAPFIGRCTYVLTVYFNIFFSFFLLKQWNLSKKRNTSINIFKIENENEKNSNSEYIKLRIKFKFKFSQWVACLISKISLIKLAFKLLCVSDDFDRVSIIHNSKLPCHFNNWYEITMIFFLMHYQKCNAQSQIHHNKCSAVTIFVRNFNFEIEYLKPRKNNSF